MQALALDQLVFNPDTQAGTAQFSVLKGVFIFASGQIAKTDKVPTYVAADRLAEQRIKDVGSMVRTWPQWPNK